VRRNSHMNPQRPTDLTSRAKRSQPSDAATKKKHAWEHREHDRFNPYGETYGQVFREQE
jgi:hypothetical protein